MTLSWVPASAGTTGLGAICRPIQTVRPIKRKIIVASATSPPSVTPAKRAPKEIPLGSSMSWNPPSVIPAKSSASRNPDERQHATGMTI